MLYGEFLNGTGAPDNLHTYSEYERINEIYNNDNSMDKAQAYAMYEKPNKLVSNLLDELKDAREQARENAYLLVKAQKQIEKLEKESRLYHSLKATVDEVIPVIHEAYYKLTD